ncbi:RNA-binding domain-containing protein [Polychaeton citri CBS 116435]|uniref:RNA-binding domain-containing protein n=1 Tax=Polychaeton citri CBS 116435 TaxID=1314669 RepID=A0A9P4QD18_9PEZI|nr:RNA-binding domain-containing protein [Polychaeton citri CBS 116435]
MALDEPSRKKQRLSDGAAAKVQSVDSSNIDENGDIKTAEPRKTEGNSLFVRGLPATTTSEILTELFSDSYPIKHAIAVLDTATKTCRGYGFVTFTEAQDALRAKSEFNGHVLNGRKLRIDIAESRHRDAGKKQDSDADTLNHKSRQREKDEESQPTKLIVRNLPWTIKHPDHLTKLFQSYGKIKQAYLPKKGGGLLSGFGFVLFRGRKNAEKAIEGVNGKEVDGRTLAVDWAVVKETFEENVPARTEEDVNQALEEEEDSGDDGDDQEGVELDDGNASDTGSEAESGLEEDDEESGNERIAERGEDRSMTLFVRNLPFTCTDEDLEDHFSQFGSTRYARIVVDAATERPKGTGFVCFYERNDADECLREAPRRLMPAPSERSGNDGKPVQNPHSILQNEENDPTGRFTMDGRVLQVTRAVDKNEANRLTEEGVSMRYYRDKDKRRLYLLSEGTVSPQSALWEKMSPSERTMREASAKQRKQLIESNPSLHLSLTRLSIRNLPRSVDSKQLKELARKSVVGFAQDVNAGKRQRLSKEEVSRGGDEMILAEKARRARGKGLVKQAKVVFEASSGSKVSEENGGRSRGYGFIEYYTHRNALMGLRWLNGHAIHYQVKQGAKAQASQEEIQDRKKRLVVEFAIENAQVVLRRNEKEQKAKDRKPLATSKDAVDRRGAQVRDGSGKRKRGPTTEASKSSVAKDGDTAPKLSHKQKIDEKIAKRNQIIGRKRAARRTRQKPSKA